MIRHASILLLALAMGCPSADSEVVETVTPEPSDNAGPNMANGETEMSATAMNAVPARPQGAGEPDPVPPDVAAPPADAERTESGLASKVIREGTGDQPRRPEDRVQVHYTGWTTDGESFDSSRTRGAPATFALNGVIAGWTEGVQLMKVGEVRRLWIPENLAYQGRPGRPAGMLVFDIELLDVTYAPEPPPAPDVPENVAAAPANAETTESGLASVVLVPGNGTRHPAETDRVEVHYSGWTTDGEMFDSSVTRGRPATFPLNRVIPGWTEGVQLMVQGEKRRFWIPANLAYEGRPGPQGTLVFDVELLNIL